jgi:hypothetical protein
MMYLCRLRAVFPFTIDGNQYFQIEYLAPSRQLALETQGSNSIIACILLLAPSLAPTKLAILQMSLIRDALLENGIESIR